MKLIKGIFAVLSCACFLFTQAQASKTEDSTQINAHEQALQKASELKLSGTVVFVDMAAKTIIVNTGKTIDTLGIKFGAKIMLGRMELSKEITLDDLYPNANVTVTYEIIENKKSAVKIVEKSTLDFPKEIH